MGDFGKKKWSFFLIAVFIVALLPSIASTRGDLTQASSSLYVGRSTFDQDPTRKPDTSTKAKPHIPDNKKTDSEQAKTGHVSTPREKKKRAMSLLEEVLALVPAVEPVEYGVLVQLNASSLLSPLDKARSELILRNAVTQMREILAEEKKPDSPVHRSRQSIRFQILRKIAIINPKLLKDLSLNATDDNTGNQISGTWTEEARALISVALDQVQNNPQLAARLAEQSMPLGYTDWQSFLRRLGRRDNNEAERLAAVLMNNLKGSSMSTALLINLKDFVFAPGRSAGIQIYFLQSLAEKLRRDLTAETSNDHLMQDVFIARDASQLSAASYNTWQAEFLSITSVLERTLSDRLVSIPDGPQRRALDVSLLLPAGKGDTKEINDLLFRVGSISDSQTRDMEYRKLAEKAAAKGDIGLADDILSRINDESTRREATLTVYSPLVRKALADSKWLEAEKQAFNILDPLGRTLALDSIAQAMSRSGEKKAEVANVYHAALDRLERESRTEQVAKAFLIVAKALLQLDADASVEAAKSAIFVLNRQSINDGSQDAPMEPALAAWVPLPNYSLTPDETLDVGELLETVIRETAKRDVDTALLIGNGLNHRGLFALARLTISKVLLEQASATATKKTARPATARHQ